MNVTAAAVDELLGASTYGQRGQADTKLDKDTRQKCAPPS